MTNWTDLNQIQKMGIRAVVAADADEFEIGQLLLDVDNGVIYAIRSGNTTTTGDRIYKWSADASSINLEFAVSSFSDNQSSSQLIGSGAWVAGTGLTFNAAYENGPATAANISCGSWASNLVLGGDFTGPVTGASPAQNANYPAAVGNSITFQLNATKSSDTDTATTSVQFLNQRCNGTSTATSLDSAGINGLGSKVVTSGKNGPFTFSPSANEYIYIAYRLALGESSFSVGGIEVELEDVQTVAHTNSAGFTENYYVYRSTNHSLLTTTIVVT